VRYEELKVELDEEKEIGAETLTLTTLPWKLNLLLFGGPLLVTKLGHVCIA
jgi:hypothetical protein